MSLWLEATKLWYKVRVVIVRFVVSAFMKFDFEQIEFKMKKDA